MNQIDITMFGLHLFGSITGIAAMFALALYIIKPDNYMMIPLLCMTFVPITISAVYAIIRGIQLRKENKQ